MKTEVIIAVLVVIGLCSIPVFLHAQGSTATPAVLGFLSITTTGPAACRPNTVGPCFIPYSATNPLPATTTGH